MNTRLSGLRPLCCAAVLLIVPLAPADGGLQPVDPAQFVVAPDQDAVLKWRLEPASSEPLPFTITGYWGRTVVTSQVTPRDGQVEVPVKLREGYYEIAFPQQKQTFGICVAPNRSGLPDPFFCIDGALSWLEHREPMRDALARILERAGIGIARERLMWGAVQPQSGQWNAGAAAGYEGVRQAYARHNVKVLEMFHDAPGWLGVGGGNCYPTDLLGAGRSWEDIRGRWQPYWAALEMWNEPDIQFGNHLPADQYVPVTKAVAFSLRNAKPAVPLAGGCFTNMCPDEFRHACARNGLLDQLDIVSFHTYLMADTVEEMVQTYRTWLKAYGKEAMPLWITESGRPWPAGPERPPMNKDAYSALDITKKAIESRACGVAAYFPFVYVHYEENGKSFGMMGKEVTPLRSMAAYVQAVSALSNKAYRGDLKVSDPSIQRARVFGDESQSVVVFYTGKSRAKATIKVDLPFTRVQGIDGRALPRAEPGQISIIDGLTYAWCDSAKIAGMLRTDTPAARLYAISRQAPPHRPSPLPIILQPIVDLKQMTASTTGYAISPEMAARFPLRVKVHNLGERSAKVALSVTAELPPTTYPSGVRNDGPPAAEVAKQSIEVASRGQTEVAWELDIARLAGTKGACALVVSGKAEGVDRISPLAMDFSIAKKVPTTRP